MWAKKVVRRYKVVVLHFATIKHVVGSGSRYPILNGGIKR